MLIIRINLLVLVIFLLLLFGASSVLAITVTISNVPSTITYQPFNFDITVSGAQSGTNYLRANLFTPGTTKYFGYTYNGSSFVNSSDYSQYFPITIDSSGSWSGTIQAKLDSASSYYNGPATYNFKVRRYTQSGSTYTWSNEVSLVVNFSTQTSTSTPSPTPSPNPLSSESTSSSTSLFTISNVPSQINSDQSFNVLVNLSLPDNPNNPLYLKGAFKKADSANYFGLTKVSGSWIKNGSTYSNQYPITSDSTGNWSGNLEIQPDSEDSGFTGTGDYIFKVGRYTSSGSGPTWSNEITVKIVSSESADQGDTITPSASNNPYSVTNPSSSTQSVKNNVVSSGQSKSYDTLVYHTATVAAATTSANPIPSIQVKNQKEPNLILWIGLGLVISGIGSLIFIYLRSRNLHEEIYYWFRRRN